MTHTFQIQGPTLTAGIVLNQNFIVIKTAPIVKYMRGWNYKKVCHYCSKRGWSIRKV